MVPITKCLKVKTSERCHLRAANEFSLWLELASDLLALTKSALVLLGKSERASFLKPPRCTRAFLKATIKEYAFASSAGPWPRRQEGHDIYERGDAGHERYANT